MRFKKEIQTPVSHFFPHMHQRMPGEVPDINQGLRSCRICFGSSNSEDDIRQKASKEASLEAFCLISPCNCKGSLRWVHRQCIRKWVLHYACSMTERPPQCELCLTPFEVKQLGLSSSFQMYPQRRHCIVGKLRIWIIFKLNSKQLL